MRSIDIPKLSLPKWMRSRVQQTLPPHHVEFDVSSVDDSTEVSSASDYSDNQSISPGTSLDVSITSPRYRSSSFDTSRLQSQQCDGEDDDTPMDQRLQVPDNSSRSKSFDAAYCAGSSSTSEDTSDKEITSRALTFLNIPKYYKRRSLEIPRLCIHCVHLETLSHESSPTSPSNSTYSRGDGENRLYTSDSFDTTEEDLDDDCITLSPYVSDNDTLMPGCPTSNNQVPISLTVDVSRTCDAAATMQQIVVEPIFHDVVTLQVHMTRNFA